MKHDHKLLTLAVVFSLLTCLSPVAQQKRTQTTLFNGKKAVITLPAIDEYNIAVGPIEVRLESSLGSRRYKLEDDSLMGSYDINPSAKVINLKPGVDALAFWAYSGAGGSGSRGKLVLLRPDKGGYFDNLLRDLTFPEQNDWDFWKVPFVSDLPLLVVARYVWGPGETHFSAHRFRVTVYRYEPEFDRYEMLDEYLTAAKYPSLDAGNEIRVLEPERWEIMARLARQH